MQRIDSEIGGLTFDALQKNPSQESAGDENSPKRLHTDSNESTEECSG